MDCEIKKVARIFYPVAGSFLPVRSALIVVAVQGLHVCFGRVDVFG